MKFKDKLREKTENNSAIIYNHLCFSYQHEGVTIDFPSTYVTTLSASQISAIKRALKTICDDLDDMLETQRVESTFVN